MQRIYLVTPRQINLDSYLDDLNDALSAGDVAAVLIATGTTSQDRLDTARALVPLVQRHGSAAIILNFSSIVDETGADGVHIETGHGNLDDALNVFKPDRVVGVSGIRTRHEALQYGEKDVDYLMFGRPYDDSLPSPSAKAVELASWWSEMTQIPAIAMAGNDLASIGPAIDSAADFIGVNRAIWEYAGGPARAIECLSEQLSKSAGI